MRARYAIGVDVGGSHIAAGLMGRSGDVVAHAEAPTPTGGQPAEAACAVITRIVELVAEVSSDVDASDIAGVGVGLPAQIDFDRQSVVWCTNLPLAGVDVRSLIADGTGHRAAIENDANCAGLGEARFGAARGVRDFVMVTLGTGVGGALVFDGSPYRGSRGLAGEIGHMVVRQGGALCPCGASGHLEAYIGSRALESLGRAAASTSGGEELRARAGGVPEAVTTRDVIEAAVAGDRAARDILLEAGETLGEAMVGIVNLLNPRMIVIGGGIGESADLLIARTAEVIAEKALAGRCDVEVVRAQLSNRAGILGAAALAFDVADGAERTDRFGNILDR